MFGLASGRMHRDIDDGFPSPNALRQEHLFYLVQDLLTCRDKAKWRENCLITTGPSLFLRLQVHAVKLASLDEVLDEVNRNTSTSLNDLRNELPQTVVSQLRFEEVIKIFRLKKDRRPIFDVQDEELISIPKYLDYDLMDIRDFITEDPTNETYSRLRLDSILRACVRDERAWLASQPDESSKTNLNKPIATLQSDLSIVVKRRRRLELLNSSVDYSIWHDDKSTLGISLVVVRVRNKAAFDAGLKECLAYSGKILFKPVESGINTLHSNDPEHPEEKPWPQRYSLRCGFRQLRLHFSSTRQRWSCESPFADMEVALIRLCSGIHGAVPSHGVSVQPAGYTPC